MIAPVWIGSELGDDEVLARARAIPPRDALGGEAWLFDQDWRDCIGVAWPDGSRWIVGMGPCLSVFVDGIDRPMVSVDGYAVDRQHLLQSYRRARSVLEKEVLYAAGAAGSA